MASNSLDRFFGGPPVRTLLWLVVLSVVIGFVLATIGLDPVTLVHRVFADFGRFVDYVLHFGSDLVGNVVRYFIYGAVVVIPIWLIARVLSYSRRS